MAMGMDYKFRKRSGNCFSGSDLDVNGFGKGFE